MIVTEEGISESNNMVIDNAGTILFVEFSSKTACYKDLSLGQRILAQNIVKAGCGNIKHCLAKISPQPNVQINSLTDIEAFSVLRLIENELVYSVIFPGKYWQQAVQKLIKR